MKRREFLSVAGGAVAISMLPSSSLLAADQTTPFYVRGLAMLSLSDPQYLRIALPKAPHHAATLVVTPSGGQPTETRIEGNGRVEGIAAGGIKPDIRLPEVVHIRELYREAVSKLDNSPTVISIPWSAVRSMSTNVVSEDRWTFVFKDTGEEVNSFRPRKIAESIKIDLVSNATLTMNGGKFSVPLAGAEQVWTDFTPTHEMAGGFEDHFGYYMPYVNTAAGAREVAPKELGRQARSVRMPALANSFAAKMYPFSACFVVQLD
jgi:hypothetical protein